MWRNYRKHLPEIIYRLISMWYEFISDITEERERESKKCTHLTFLILDIFDTNVENNVEKKTIRRIDKNKNKIKTYMRQDYNWWFDTIKFIESFLQYHRYNINLSYYRIYNT